MMRAPRTGRNPAPSFRGIAATYAVFATVLAFVVALSSPALAVPVLGGLLAGVGLGVVVSRL